MARGFESKSVADQQESVLAPPRPAADHALDPATQQKKRGLELSRADILHRIETARAEGHREVLQKALDAIDKELKRLS
jgi:hypothetical protein